MTRYMYREEDYVEEFEADSEDEAIQWARDKFREGDYELQSSTWWGECSVEELDADGAPTGNVFPLTVPMDPEEPACISKGTKHAWSDDHSIVGGCKESPGVFGHGGGVKSHYVCLLCGCERVHDSWAQNPVNGQQGLDSVEYQDSEIDFDDRLALCDGDQVRLLIKHDYLDLEKLTEGASWVDGDPIASYTCQDGDTPMTIDVISQSAECGGITAYRWRESDASDYYDSGKPTLDEDGMQIEAQSHADEQDDSVDYDDTVKSILDSEFFCKNVTEKDVKDLCVRAAGYSQGDLLIGREGQWEWVTNGYIEVPHIRVTATHDSAEFAAVSLLQAIDAFQRLEIEEDEES